jgi:hypothetical protein
MKALAKYFLIAAPWLLLLFLGATYLWTRMFSFPWVWQETGRVAAPSGAYEVVTYQGNRGAMSSFAYVSFLVKPGGTTDPNACDLYEPVLSTTHTAPKPHWENNARLVISCEGGYVRHQRPYSREFNVAIVFEGVDNPPRLPGQ